MATTTAMPPRSDAYCIRNFCKRHDISPAFLYELWRRGDGPRYMLVGQKRLIADEAAAEWRRSTESAASSRNQIAA